MCGLPGRCSCGCVTSGCVTICASHAGVAASCYGTVEAKLSSNWFALWLGQSVWFAMGALRDVDSCVYAHFADRPKAGM